MNRQFTLLLTTALTFGIFSIGAAKAQGASIGDDVLYGENPRGLDSSPGGMRPIEEFTDEVEILGAGKGGKFVGGVTEHQTTPDRGVPMAKVAHSR